MPRTTLDIDAVVLRELKRRQRREGKTLGSLVSELLSQALANAVREAPPPLNWTGRPMGLRVDLDDREAVRRAIGDGYPRMQD